MMLWHRLVQVLQDLVHRNGTDKVRSTVVIVAAAAAAAAAVGQRSSGRAAGGLVGRGRRFVGTSANLQARRVNDWGFQGDRLRRCGCHPTLLVGHRRRRRLIPSEVGLGRSGRIGCRFTFLLGGCLRRRLVLVQRGTQFGTAGGDLLKVGLARSLRCRR
uniref:(northern house mosquito) hypothetical protein n=2 Tax=Culex pipiens TaxID=7175 RepID=A0A8D8EQQ3_CULPI